MIAGDVAFDTAQTGSRPPVADFPESLHWVNCRERAKLADWRGQVVLVVFFSSNHTVRAILLFLHKFFIKRLCKTWPPTAGIKFIH